MLPFDAMPSLTIREPSRELSSATAVVHLPCSSGSVELIITGPVH